jgi:hypothetical protein
MSMPATTAVVAAAAVPFSTVVYDPAGMCTTGAGAKVTVPVDGYYLCTAAAQNTTTAVTFLIELYHNGGVDTYGSDSGVSGTGEISNVAALVKCAAGDTLQVFSAATTSVAGGSGTFTVTFIAPA